MALLPIPMTERDQLYRKILLRRGRPYAILASCRLPQTIWEPRVRRGLSRNHGFLRMVCYGLQRYPRHHMTPQPSTT